MKISVLLPMRDSDSDSVDGLRTLIENRTGDNELEILFGVDRDDDSWKQVTAMLDEEFPEIEYVVCVTKQFGYTSLYEYMNRLAALSTGDWLMMWNNDVYMIGKTWDLGINKDLFKLYYLQSDNQCEFPVFPRKWFELTGRISLSRHCDSWMLYIGREILTKEGAVLSELPNSRVNHLKKVKQVYDNKHFKDLASERNIDKNRIVDYLKSEGLI